MKLSLKIFASILVFFTGNIVFANINMTVSPIKYEIDAFTGTTITKTAKLYNYTQSSYFIETGKSDFIAGNKNGKPRFVRKSELVYPDQQLSSWITIDTDSFTIGPNEEKEVTFTIDIPSDATPGWHYGAVFFKKQSSHDTHISSSSNIWVNIDYWVLILVNVDGEVITKWEVEDVIIHPWNNWIEENENYKKPLDSCPFWDLSYSNYDWKCYDNPFTPPKTETGSIEDQETTSNDKKQDNFGVTFEIPFKNTWNTHLKPQWKIKLIDENGKQIKWVGKKIISDSNGIIIKEEIVDYLPINDIWGNVLPNSQRNFNTQWKWFPHQWYDEEGTQIIEYWTPSEFYTLKNQEKEGFVMFWERVLERKKTKTITAEVDLSYQDNNGEDIQFNSAKEFDIEYSEKYVGLNYYVCIPLLFITFLLFIFLLILYKKRKKCPACWETVKKKMKICPYCWEKLKKKKKKKS